MRVKVITLMLAGALFLSPLAMASDLGSADSNFLFGKDQVAATAISDQEMTQTEGQLLGINPGALLGLAIGEVNWLVIKTFNETNFLVKTLTKIIK